MNLLQRIVAMLLVSCSTLAYSQEPSSKQQPWNTPHTGNPFLPGYNADATVLQEGGITYVFATEDPWGARTLACWMSADMVRWSSCALNWPTKEAATSPLSNSSMVWAPSLVHAPNGRFYLYVSVGSEVWVGVADRPLGPWKNALGSRPLIPASFNRKYHMIDAEAFIDTDGQAYLYWGSGLNWVNGHCFVVKLKPDMVTFDGEPKDITPTHYFEGPFLFKHGGTYFLMYSEGKTTDDTYNVRWSSSSSPLGPFREGATSPLLVSDGANNILGPGHHAVFQRDGKVYITYHRHSLPFQTAQALRQLCMDELIVDDRTHTLRKVVPTHAGPSLLHTVQRNAGALSATVTASSTQAEVFAPKTVLDDNYATRWQPAASDRTPWISLDLGREITGARTAIEFEYAWKRYRYRLESSLDGQHWTTFADAMAEGTSGSPTQFAPLPRTRYLRLNFDGGTPAGELAIFEWQVYPAT